jgi:hypothetical protein
MVKLINNIFQVFALILILLIASCSRYLYKQNQNLELKITTYQQFKKERIYATKDVGFTLENDLNSYKVIESKINHADGAMNYLYAFRNDTLIQFGYPYQFSQHTDELINKIGKYYSEFIFKEPKFF